MAELGGLGVMRKPSLLRTLGCRWRCPEAEFSGENLEESPEPGRYLRSVTGSLEPRLGLHRPEAGVQSPGAQSRACLWSVAIDVDSLGELRLEAFKPLKEVSSGFSNGNLCRGCSPGVGGGGVEACV